MSTPLSRKTKTELMEEYNKLLTQHEELRRTATLVSDPQSVALLSKAADYTADQVAQDISGLKSSVNVTLNELADKLIAETQKFSELQKAIDLAKKNLELHYHIQVAADTLDRLIQEHKTKTLALEEEITTKQRDWTREQEERGYAFNLELRRNQEEFVEAKVKQDRALKEREEALKQQEQEVAQLRAQVTAFPANLEKALVGCEQETAKRLHAEFDGQLASAKKDWSAQEQLYKLTISGLEERLKEEQAEITALKGEVEKSNKRVQELTIKIIESNTRMPLKPEETKTLIHSALNV